MAGRALDREEGAALRLRPHWPVLGDDTRGRVEPPEGVARSNGRPAQDSGPRPADGKAGLKERVAVFEKSLIEVALIAAHGSQRRAAEALGVLPSTLHAKLRRHGLASTCRSLRASAAESGAEDLDDDA